MSERIGGRPRQIEEADIVRAGRELGLTGLSLKAVATRLSVSSTALYRHVDGRWGLERLVGESLMEELHLPDDPALDLVQHLVAFGTGLRAFALEHPGLAAYLQTLFPRGEGGRRVLAEEIEALGHRGYSPEAALVVCSGVASIAIGHAAAEETQRARGAELQAQELTAWEDVRADGRLDAAHRDLPQVDAAQYARLMLTIAVQGMVAAVPPGRPVADAVAALDAVMPQTETTAPPPAPGAQTPAAQAAAAQSPTAQSPTAQASSTASGAR